jgi:hypothetical protein
MHRTVSHAAVAAYLLQQLCTLLLAAAALTMVVLTGAALGGFLPWMELPVSLGGEAVADAGMWAQIGVTALLLVLVGFLPTNARVRRLEVTNRDFQVGMEDVAQAYAQVHRADREGVFRAGREFDAVRERIDWMRHHPDLAELEHDVLLLAAQMSVESRELAEIYSAEKVERARSFLRQRQKEIEDYRDRISMAQATVGEMRRWMQAISVEEGLAERQLDRLQKDLADITEAMKLTGRDDGGKIVKMGRREGTGDVASTPAE